MKTKPFNLEKALKGAKVVTRDGIEVIQLTKFDTSEGSKLIGIIKYDEDNKNLKYWRCDGTFYSEGKSIYDLFIALETKSIWANVYIGSNDYPYVGEYFKTEEEAKEFSSKMPKYIKTIEITDEP